MDFKEFAAELKAKIEASEAKIKELEAKLADKVSVEEKSAIEEQIKNLDLTAQEFKNELKTVKTDKVNKGFIENFSELVHSDNFKSQLKEVLEGKRAKSEKFEVKIATSDATNPVLRTTGNTNIYSAAFEPNVFISKANMFTVPADKNRIVWLNGSFTDNTGYVDEATAGSTANAGTIAEVYRELAKLHSFVPFSAETASDMSYFVNWVRNKSIEAINSKIDTLIYAGTGNDSTATKEIYGLKTQGSTAFNASTAGLADAIENATIADLVRACVAQIRIGGKGAFTPNAVFMHPADVAKLNSAKNKVGDYIQIMPTGQYFIYGLPVYETANISAGELLVSDTSTWQLYQKGAIEVEIDRAASTDSYVLYLRWRGNFVVSTEDKKGNIYVASIPTAIAAIGVDTPLAVTASISNTELDVNITNTAVPVSGSVTIANTTLDPVNTKEVSAT